jgi:hypothetical protein
VVDPYTKLVLEVDPVALVAQEAAILQHLSLGQGVELALQF